MPHNLVITAPGAMERIGQAAELMGPKGAERHHVPPDQDVLWHTDLLMPGQSTRLMFEAPETPGEYPFVCTFPGHWRVMNGVMHVVQGFDDKLNQRDAAPMVETAATREFVKMWTMKDFEGSFEDGWTKNLSLTTGSKLMDEAGCIKCHKFNDRNKDNPVDITAVNKKYQGLELLRQILEPSKTLLEGFENWGVALKDDDWIVGRIAKEDDHTLHLVPNMQAPEEVVVINKSEIEERRKMKLSAMPTGLLVTLTKDEILALVHYLQSGEQ